MKKVGVPLVQMVSRASAAITHSSVHSQGTLAHSTPLESSNRMMKQVKDMPAPPQWPFVAHLPLMMKKNVHILFSELRDELGDTYRITVPGKGDMVVVNNPEDIKTLYNSDGKIPINDSYDVLAYIKEKAMKDRFVSPGLFSNNADWHEVRTKVQQDMMKPKSAFYYIEEIEDIAMELVEKVNRERGEDELFDPSRALQEYALEAVGCVFMGRRLGSLKEEGDAKRLIENNAQILPLMTKVFFLPQLVWPYHPSCIQLASLYSESFDICKKHIEIALDQVKDEDDSLLAKLVRKCGKESGIPMALGVDTLTASYGVAGTGSSAISLLRHLAANPDKKEILYKEICQVIGPNGTMSEKALNEMRYMKACQTESQRMLPAAVFSNRKTTVDMVLGGYQIPAGTTVIKNGYGTSNDSRQFPQPEEFMPERWLRNCPERTVAHPYANIPFGHGSRSCVGRRFAQLELYIFMVKMVQKFKMEYDVQKSVSNIKFSERSS